MLRTHVVLHNDPSPLPDKLLTEKYSSLLFKVFDSVSRRFLRRSWVILTGAAGTEATPPSNIVVEFCPGFNTAKVKDAKIVTRVSRFWSIVHGLICRGEDLLYLVVMSIPCRCI